MVEIINPTLGLAEGDDREFAAQYSFPLDRFQLEAIAALQEGRSVLVTAPTGTGKTVIAEYGIFHARRAGKRAIYTAPIKAVSNQKYRDFCALYPGEVGLLTGDIVENRYAPILVMTTEIARNMLIQEPESFGDVGVLIFDEVHYLADRERGTTWEETIVFCPPQIPIVCLSATLANAREFADWLTYAHGNVALVQYNQRPVPLEYLYFTRNGRLEVTLDAQGQIVQSFKGHGGENKLIQARGSFIHGNHQQRLGQFIDETPPSKLAKAMAAADMLPTIYFMFSRRDVEVKALECAQDAELLSPDEQTIAVNAFDNYLADWTEDDRALKQVQNMRRLIQRGVAYHHAGILPALKVVVERLFNAGNIKLVFSTDTLALGINMPARSVVIGALNKFDGQGRRPLYSNEMRQMGGRAGRRGIDARGYIVLPWSPWSTWTEATAIATGALEPIKSSFSLRYNAVLNLLADGDSARLDRLITRSLLAFQNDSRMEILRQRRAQLIAEASSFAIACTEGARDEELLEFVSAQERLASVERRAEELEKQLAGQAPGKTRNKDTVRALSELKRTRKARVTLRQKMRRFRCYPCPLKDKHLPALEREHSRQFALAKIEGQMAQRDPQLQMRGNTRRYLSNMLEVLKYFGYLDAKGTPSAKADRLRNVFDDNCLVIAEMIERGILNKLAPAQIAEVFCWFAFDRDTTNIHSEFPLPAILHDVRDAIDEIVDLVLYVERRHKVALSKPVDKGLPGIALQWAQGATFSYLLANIRGVSEGDIVVTLNKTLDLMRQVREMLDKTGGRDGRLRANIAKAEALTRRGVVAQYTTLFLQENDQDGETTPETEIEAEAAAASDPDPAAVPASAAAPTQKLATSHRGRQPRRPRPSTETNPFDGLS